MSRAYTKRRRRPDAVAECARKRALERSPNDPDLLLGLAAFSRDAGRLPEARGYAERLAAIAPHDERAQGFLRELSGK
jgi:hypothetical protein